MKSIITFLLLIPISAFAGKTCGHDTVTIKRFLTKLENKLYKGKSVNKWYEDGRITTQRKKDSFTLDKDYEISNAWKQYGEDCDSRWCHEWEIRYRIVGDCLMVQDNNVATVNKSSSTELDISGTYSGQSDFRHQFKIDGNKLLRRELNSEEGKPTEKKNFIGKFKN